jgi:hypothetical protein
MDHHFVICVRNKGYEASLEARKLYEALADQTAEERQQIRVIDESGEDYLYPKDLFMKIEIPKVVEQALFREA